MKNPNRFNYLIEKIKKTEFQTKPFNFIYIENFLSKEDLKEIISAKEINTSIEEKSDRELIKLLEENNYVSQDFPGCTTNKEKYIYNRRKNNKVKSIYDGLGYVMRLMTTKTDVVTELNEFFSSNEFKDSICRKFNLEEELNIDTGIQKYLSNYAIAPHPDVRSKAATWMLNINTHESAETAAIHTNLCSFKDEYKYIHSFWNKNLNFDRAWVPWNWCNTDFTSTKNNSIILFSPNDYSLHSIKLNYNHFPFQRTQFYGNLWYTNDKYKKLKYVTFEYLDLASKINKGIPDYTKKINHKVVKKSNLLNPYKYLNKLKF